MASRRTTPQKPPSRTRGQAATRPAGKGGRKGWPRKGEGTGIPRGVKVDPRPGMGVVGLGVGVDWGTPATRQPGGNRGLARDMYGPEVMGGGPDAFMLGQGKGLSPIIDVLRGLGNESAGVFARPPRRLAFSEIAAMGQDGIGRRVFTVKVEQALAPGYAIDLTGLEPTVAQAVVAAATKVFRRIKGAEHIVATGVRAQWMGKAIGVTSYLSDRGLLDLCVPLSVVASQDSDHGGVGNGIRWMSEWDQRDYRVRELAPSTSTHYRQGEGSTWIDLYPLHPALEYDRLYGWGGARATSDPSAVRVHPSRYCQLTTTTGFSIFQECAVYIANLLAAASGSASLMQRAAAGVMELADWETQSLAGADETRQKLQAQYEALSHLNLMFLAQGEKFTWADLSTSGIEGGLYAIAYLLSAATGIPMTILLGTSPGAFVSGDQQIKQWHQELDRTRAWLEPLIRFVWDQCIAEVTGGYVGEYAIVWNPYETPTQDEKLTTMGQALDLALKAMGAGLLSADAVLAGLSQTGALGFDWGAALAQKKDAGNDKGHAPLDPALFTTLVTALTSYYTAQGGQVPQPAMAMLVSMLSPAMAAAAPTLVQTPPAPVAPVATAPGAPVMAGAGAGAVGQGVDAGGPPAGPTPPKKPGDPYTPDDLMQAENWAPLDEAGALFSLSPTSLKTMMTDTPGVMAPPGKIAWVQNPVTGVRRVRKTDVAAAMLGGRAAVAKHEAEQAALALAEGAENTETEETTGVAADFAYEAWPVDGIPWRMIRQSDETGVSGTGEVVRGRVLHDGTLISWWVVPDMPPRPHVDGCWADFWAVHISQHPSNGTIIEQQGADGVWRGVPDLARGPGPWCDPGHVCWPGDGCPVSTDVDPNVLGKVGLQVIARVENTHIHGPGVAAGAAQVGSNSAPDNHSPGYEGTRKVSGDSVDEDGGES